ncbi:helix-hairpin-helix domain-containing protein [Parapedobacter koreensis]|uniref:Helix-hairpin-helix motif-containing protein n=1 Tax=Parapedobacter koreensis TaxID=332977 RepID=A0A1H7TER5_9SPHI|nr:helix-hairpin-helix domain-containing protein [Parapedobacter koreensis]SEL83311.1 Helix-hairpin-helix motif-containing protein [Parapedobacter koreensis]
MRFNRYVILVVGLLAMSGLYAQSETDLLMERLTELVAEELTEDFDFSELAERLEFYERHPIDLNATDGRELRELQFLPQLFIDNLLEHREQSGKFVAIYELQAIEGLDIELLRLLLPYIVVSAPRALSEVSVSQLLKEGTHDVMVRYGRTLQQRRGYAITDTSRSRYLGTPDQVFARYRYHFGRDLQVALNMKKDAGEAFFGGPQRYGFDFYSGSVYIRNQGWLKDVVVGDYALQFGQGLAMWSGIGFGKGSMLQGIAKQAMGLRPYTSSNEVSFLRGGAATIAFGRLSVTPFFSGRRLDGSAYDTTGDEPAVGSISQTGLHRTPTETANRHALSQRAYGANMQYESRRLRIGATAYHTRFNAAIQPQNLLRNRFAFRGRSLWNTSLYYNHSWRGIYLFGEVAHRIGSGFALVNGLMTSLHPHLSLALHYRNYQRDYHSFFNQGMAEGSGAANERGFYSGLAYHPNRAVEWVLYADFFRFPWLRYRVDAPSRGADLLTQFTYTWYKRADITIRYRYRQREENAATTASHNAIVDVLRQQVRVSGQYKLNDTWRMRNRLELAHYQKEGNATELGWMVYHDVIFKPMSGRLSGNMRVALFATPGYNSRIYAFENDVLYAYSFPLYHNDGIRTYANLRYRFGRKLDVWVRYATFIYYDVEEVGSGLDAIEGNQRSDIRLQIRWQF